jgi:hypothetical protein
MAHGRLGKIQIENDFLWVERGLWMSAELFLSSTYLLVFFLGVVNLVRIRYRHIYKKNSISCVRVNNPQSTYINRAPQCMSLRRNWDSPMHPPLSPASVPLPPEPGGAHSPAGEGLGESQFRRLEKKLSTLPTS